MFICLLPFIIYNKSILGILAVAVPVEKNDTFITSYEIMYYNGFVSRWEMTCFNGPLMGELGIFDVFV